MRLTFDDIESLVERGLSFWQFLADYPAERPFRFHSSVDECTELAPADLAGAVRAVGTALQEFPAQSRVLLLVPSAPSYVVAVLGCFYANQVAVPTVFDPSARTRAMADTIGRVLDDSGAAVILGDSGTLAWLRDALPAGRMPSLLDIEDLRARSLRAPEALRRPDDLALIMYTSGSTAQPKGVMISHRSLMFQVAMCSVLWGIGDDSVVVSWLSLAHNFGLPMSVLIPVLTGARSVVVRSGLFVEQPRAWLELMARYGGTHGGAPNYALDYCTHNVTDPATLDLRTVQVIACGGEPVRGTTVAGFNTHFAPSGLDPAAVRPNYGLTETAGFITETLGEPLVVRSYDGARLGLNEAVPAASGAGGRDMVRAGRPRGPVEILAVDPVTRLTCPERIVGEIWFRGTGTGQGYYRNEAATAEAFGAVLADTGEGAYFRTGDLGFFDEGCLYLVSRSKDVMIVNGMKYYPTDVEATLQREVPELVLSTAAFSVDVDGNEALVVVQEVDPGTAPGLLRELAGRMTATVSAFYGLPLFDVVLVPPGTIPRTGIGKLQRARCRTSYLAGDLPALYRRRRVPQPEDEPAPDDEFVRVVVAAMAAVLDLEPDDVLAAGSLAEAGCGSIQYLQLARRLSELSERPLAAADLLVHNRIEDLVAFLASPLEDSPAEPDRSEAAAPSGRSDDEGVAIVGLSCALPGRVDGLAALWALLASGNDAVETIRTARPELLAQFEACGVDQDSLPAHAAFVEHTADFDAAFFRMSNAEAESADPRQRKLLELAWAALEDAGIPPAQVRGSRTGVFVGVNNNDYAELAAARPGLVADYGPLLDTGLHESLLSNRLSRRFDLRGPSEVVNAACASSMLALIHAADALAAGTADLCLVGGANALLSARPFAVGAAAGLLSRRGRCAAFDVAADGFVRAEAFAVLVLKPLAAARLDGDHVYAVIRGRGVSHDGASTGLRAPTVAGQESAIRAAWGSAERVSLVVAHGTGTPLGDSVEVRALARAVSATHPPLRVITAKPTFGHAEGASGLVSVLTALACLKAGAVPGVAHFTEPHPGLGLTGTPLEVVRRVTPWDPPGLGQPRRVGINAFGYGGTNAHVVLEEPPEPDVQPQPPPVPLALPIVVSAHSGTALRPTAPRLAQFLRSSSVSLPDVAHTLAVGRTHFAHRIAVVADTSRSAADALESASSGGGDAEPVPAASLSANAAQDLSRWLRGDTDTLGDATPQGRRVPVPGIVLDRRRHWFRRALPLVETPDGRHPLLEANVSDFRGVQHRTRLTARHPAVHDEAYGAPGVVHPALWLEAARAAHAAAVGSEPGVVNLRQVRWPHTLSPDGDGYPPVTIGVSPSGEAGWVDFDCFSGDDDSVRIYCQGQVGPAVGLAAEPWSPVAGSVWGPDRIQEVLGEAGIRHGASMSALQSFTWSDAAATFVLDTPNEQDWPGYGVQPSLLAGAVDAALLALVAGTGADPRSFGGPFGADAVTLVTEPGPRAQGMVRLNGGGADVALYSASGRPLFVCAGLTFRRPFAMAGSAADVNLQWATSLRP